MCIACDDDCTYQRRHGGTCEVAPGECAGCPAAVVVEPEESTEAAEGGDDEEEVTTW